MPNSVDVVVVVELMPGICRMGMGLLLLADTGAASYATLIAIGITLASIAV